VTLRSRLILLFGFVALAVSVVVGGSSYRATSSEVAGATDDFLQARAADIVDGARETPRDRRSQRNNGGNTVLGLAFDPDAIVQSVAADGVVRSTSSRSLPITDATQRVIDLRVENNQRQFGVFEDITINGEPYRMFTQTLPNGGALQVARSTAEDDSLLRSLLTRFVVIAAAATVGASLLGWWIARRTTEPLRRLADVAATVTETRDFSVDVPVDRSDEIGTLAASLRTMLTALETSQRQQRSLVQDASHELRTPLTSLRANVALLERIENAPVQVTPDDRAAVLAAISAEVAELGSLFDELIDLAAESDDRDAPLVPLRLDEVVARAVGRWEQRTDRVIELRTEPITINGNEAMLERAVTNLIGNAHKFSPPDEPVEVVVELLGSRDGRVGSGPSDVGVSVRDGGPGIPPSDRARVFDRFHRAETTRTMPGSGLGLAIVAQIVEHHGGEVWATDSDRGGADVGFRVAVVAD
jgi:two-component system sensor histidine kinase MprB